MISKPIYKPAGRALEYGALACNIYRGCPHKCGYCFAPDVLHVDRAQFHAHVEPRRDIVESVKRQLAREKITGQLILLCFTCDPYPSGIDTTPTREVIQAIKDAGNHVQILTKGGRRALRDFELLDDFDHFGISLSTYSASGVEPDADMVFERIDTLIEAKSRGIMTWISFEPVLSPGDVYHFLNSEYARVVDVFKFGILNHYKPEDFGFKPIDWAAYGRTVEQICKKRGFEYYIKKDLRREMEAAPK